MSLRETIENLAAAPLIQAARLEKLGLSNLDELALEFDDAYVSTFHRRHELSPEVWLEIGSLNDMLASLSGTDSESSWHMEAVSSQKWEEIRTQASRVLECWDRDLQSD